ncbi:MAG: M61 family peptidase, partial [Acidobacteriota bacterium]
MKKNDCRKITLVFALLVIQVSIAFAQTAIKLDVDATEAAKNIIHVRETMPVKAGEFALFYPKWIPGEHAPTGTLNDIVNLYITANGKQLAWRRDDVEMFEFHLTIPNGVKEVEIAFDDVSQPGTIASANLSRIKWNRLILYPEGAKADDVNVMAALKLPADWKYATALETANETANPVQFKQVTLTKLVDSPAVVGKFYKKIPLIEVGGAMHEIDAFADSAEALEYNPATLEGWKNLIKQANAAFGAHHYNNYKFLLTLSDVGGSEGLEHHQSSEDGVGEKSFTDAYRLLDLGDLLGHEYTHSWNGKYRRPAGLATGDYETPMKAEFLWVYEGLTQYLGHVFPTRSGLWTPEDYREVLAADAADLNNETGRRWRPLVDTARAVQFTYGSPRAWRNERRRVDYYDEGA